MDWTKDAILKEKKAWSCVSVHIESSADLDVEQVRHCPQTQNNNVTSALGYSKDTLKPLLPKSPDLCNWHFRQSQYGPDLKYTLTTIKVWSYYSVIWGSHPPRPPDTRAQSSPRSAAGRRLRFRLLNPSAVLRLPSAPADPSRAFCLMSARICLPLRPAVSQTNHGGYKQRPNPGPWRPVPAQIGFPLTEKKH